MEPGTTKRNTLRENPLAKTVHLAQDCEANLRYVKNHLWQTAGQLFRETDKLVSGQTESAGMSVIDFKIWGWCRPAYCTVELINVSLRKPTPSPTLCSVWERWETVLLNLGRAKFNGIRTTIVSRIWIELMDNLWNSIGRFSQDSQQWDSLIFFNRWWENYSVNQRTSLVGSSFMSMFNDIVWDAKGNDEICENNSKTIEQFARRIPRGHWSFLGLGFEKERYATYDYKPDGSWDRIAEKMLLTFAETNHPAFRGASVWERGDSRRKWKEVNTLPWQHQRHWVASPNGHLRQPAQHLRSSDGYDWRINSWSESCGKTQSTRSTG